MQKRISNQHIYAIPYVGGSTTVRHGDGRSDRGRKMPQQRVEAPDLTADPVSMVDIGGRRLVFSAMGKCGPTVVLETGLGAESAEWATVQERLAPTIRACRYDRANRGWSEPARRPRVARQMVDDLHALVHAAGETGPYILV